MDFQSGNEMEQTNFIPRTPLRKISENQTQHNTPKGSLLSGAIRIPTKKEHSSTSKLSKKNNSSSATHSYMQTTEAFRFVFLKYIFGIPLNI